jgi:hypothetical protein
MATNLPVDFEERVKRPKGKSGEDYPYAIKARDLMEDFVYAALDVDATLIQDAVGQGGHKQRRLKIPALPSDDQPAQLTTQGGSLSWQAPAVPTGGMEIPEPPSSGFFVLASIGGVVQWVETEACD